MSRFFVSLCLFIGIASPMEGATCEGLRALTLTNVTITATQLVAAGTFIPPDQSSAVPPGTTLPVTARATLSALPAFCRVQGVIRPSSDSNIRFEVWLPSSTWNARYLGVGNGGGAGRIPYDGDLDTPGLIQGLEQGFATAATDTGHEGRGDDYSFGRDHPERRIDYNYRAIHQTAVTANQVIRAFYGSAPRYSYFWGRSTGGTEGLMEAQRFPDDYDGVLAASPVVDRARTWAVWVWTAQAFASPEARIPESKLSLVQAAVVTACDTADGLRDGVVGDPTRCHFDPDVLSCRDSDQSQCLTQPQVAALRKYYAGPRTPNGEQIAAPFPPGAQACLFLSMTCEGSAARRATDWTGGLVSASWNVQTFRFDRDVQKLFDDPDMKDASATAANLKPFMDRGGKLIIEHGWSDGTTIPMQTVQYFENIASTMGQKAVDRFVRLYMIPGMSHNGSPGLPRAVTGPGVTRFTALRRWVEQGKAPERIVASNVLNGQAVNEIKRTYLLCPYPRVAVYEGNGSINDAKNFGCAFLK
jgi:hypothetical protein